MRQPRIYQCEAVDEIWVELKVKDLPSTLVVMATGLGKTVVAATLFNYWPAELGWILFLAHRDTLIRQAADTFREECPGHRVQVEMASERAERAPDWYNQEPHIVVASKDTLCQAHRLHTFPRDRFGLIVVDEGHRWVAKNKSYQAIMDYFTHAKRLGLTATPDRGDKLALRQSYASVAYDYGIRAGSDDGWLVPIVQQLVTVTGYDLSRCRKAAGDLRLEDVDREIRREKVLAGIADPTVQLADLGGERRPTLLFTPSVESAKELAAVINRQRPGLAVPLYGEVDKEERKDKLARFHRGEYQFLVSCDLLTEGFDEDTVRVVAIARPTTSRGKYAQMVGRGTRPLKVIIPALNATRTAEERLALIRQSGKRGLLVVDFVGNAGKHKLITCGDLLAGKDDEEACRRAKARIAEQGRGVVVEEIKRAQAALEEEERARQEERKDMVITTEFVTRDVDPFDRHAQATPRKQPPPHIPASEGQKKFLLECGFPAHFVEGLSSHRARGIMAKVIKERNKGPASTGQREVLERFGYNSDTTFAEARRILDELKRNGWRRADTVEYGEETSRQG